MMVNATFPGGIAASSRRMMLFSASAADAPADSLVSKSSEPSRGKVRGSGSRNSERERDRRASRGIASASCAASTFNRAKTTSLANSMCGFQFSTSSVFHAGKRCVASDSSSAISAKIGSTACFQSAASASQAEFSSLVISANSASRAEEIFDCCVFASPSICATRAFRSCEIRAVFSSRNRLARSSMRCACVSIFPRLAVANPDSISPARFHCAEISECVATNSASMRANSFSCSAAEPLRQKS